MSPEALNKDESTEHQGVDLWALGCIVYKFFEGKTPFADSDQRTIFEKISHKELAFENNTPIEAQDLIKKLLHKDPKKRIGYENINEIKEHQFFNGIDFANILELDPPDDPIIHTMTKRLVKGKSHANLNTHKKNSEYIGLESNKVREMLNSNECFNGKRKRASKCDLEINLEDNKSRFLIEHKHSEHIKRSLFIEDSVILEGKFMLINKI